MATVIYIKEGRQNRSAMRAVINYCQQEYKTYDSKSGRRLVSGINCDGDNTFHEFMATKKVHGKDNGVFFYQYVQSFSPTEKITPEQGLYIKYRLKCMGTSSADIALEVGCTPVSVSNVLSGKSHSQRIERAVASRLGYKSWNDMVTELREKAA